uniref:Cytochrome c oxidase subunit 3 n=1 Tax=Solanum lycopersicum TaxID=4081 RepID=A0A3Q7FGP0_SOLLC
MIESRRHSYHLVDQSPWPILGSLTALATTVGGVMYLHSFQGEATLLILGLIFLLYTMFVWWRDVLCESTFEGYHTKDVQMVLFFLSYRPPTPINRSFFLYFAKQREKWIQLPLEEFLKLIKEF